MTSILALPLLLLGLSIPGAPAPVVTAPVSPPPLRTTDFVSLEAARDTIETTIRHSFDFADSAHQMASGPIHFKYWYAPGWADGWEFHIVVNDTLGCPNSVVEKALIAEGWEPKYDYMADGPDGGIMGLTTNHYLCVIEGRWDGGDPTDASYIPERGCEVFVTCVPRLENDAIAP